ncbi:MAG: hypothetical protein US09_C0017G0016 [Candidatus Moranbacteria bacterium GW2011_GWD1_36_198]|nr:MAG: hypothetical protein US09_C0017G0016 [Candidatus Moranbacteria bacterium GW2011_GWD1_36_198]
MKNKIKPVVHERQVKKQRSGVFFAILLVGLFFGVQIDVIYAAEIKSACIVGGQGIWNATTGKCACVVAGKVPNAQGYCADPIINNAYENDGGGAGAAAYAPDAGTESIYNRPLTSGETTQPQTKKLSYTLLESFPGFFQGGKEMTDLPTMILAIYKFGIWTVGIAS